MIINYGKKCGIMDWTESKMIVQSMYIDGLKWDFQPKLPRPQLLRWNLPNKPSPLSIFSDSVSSSRASDGFCVRVCHCEQEGNKPRPY